MRPADQVRDRAVIVTGASGVAGRHVLAALTKREIDAVAVTRSGDGGTHGAELQRPDDVSRIPSGRGVVHCAGVTPGKGSGWSSFYEGNVLTSENLAREALRRQWTFFIYLSTHGSTVPQGTVAARDYVRSKVMAEERLTALLHGHVPLWILRPASIYGEYDRGSMAKLIRAVVGGRFVLPSSGRNRKCLLYAGALADVIAVEIADGLTGTRTEGISDLVVPRLIDIVELIATLTGVRVRRLALSDRHISALLSATEFIARGVHAATILRQLEGVRVALRDVPCPRENALLRHTEYATDLRSGLERQILWMREARAI